MKFTPILSLALLFNGITAEDNAASKVLTKDNKDLVKKGLWFVKLYTPSCKYSRRLAPHWTNITESLRAWSNDAKFNFAEVDCKENSSLCSDLKVDGFPTLNLFKDGEYQGECLTREGADELLICVKDYVDKYQLKAPEKLQV
ncbi:hypothetical protein K502DRAFT_363657, partial [Neoconidiobolus thromboides FSU 785]